MHYVVFQSQKMLQKYLEKQLAEDLIAKVTHYMDSKTG